MARCLWLVPVLAALMTEFLSPWRPGQSQSVTPVAAVPGSPSVEADGYVYVAAQGPRRADGSTPIKFGDQVRQCLDNIEQIIEAAGLTKDHIAYVQVYSENTDSYEELNEAFAAYFPKDPPARAVLGVARVAAPPLQIAAVAVRDLKGKQRVSVPGWRANKAFSVGMLTHDRLFISTMPGSDPKSGVVPENPSEQVDLALDRLSAVLQAVGLANANMVFINPYLSKEIPMRIMNEHYARRFEFGNTPGRATIEVSSLPEGAHIAYTGVAVRDLSRRKAVRPKNMPPSPTASPCVFAGDTLYCSAKSGFIPGPNGGVFAAATKDQTRQTMRNQLDNLEEADMNFEQVVSVTIYLDDITESPSYADVYKKYFKGPLPAATTVQQLKPTDRKPDDGGHYPDLEQMSLIAVRNHKN